eukprot:752809-Hanusia_phi.AAC.1
MCRLCCWLRTSFPADLPSPPSPSSCQTKASCPNGQHHPVASPLGRSTGSLSRDEKLTELAGQPTHSRGFFHVRHPDQ